MARWPTISAGSRATFWRSLQTFTVTRIVITVLLLLYLSFDAGRARLAGSGYGETCVIYVAGALLFAWLAHFRRRRFLLQLGAQVLADIGFISLLYLAAGGMASGFALLYLFPLAGAAILAPLLMALFSAALATLFVLGDSVWQILRFNDPPLMQAGMSGAAFFALVLVVNRLAAKLIRQEELAAQRGADLRIQQAIYRIVVDDVDDGILVLGRDGFVFAGNPAARRMLGLELDTAEGEGLTGFRLAEVAALEPVAHSFEAWLAQGGADGMALPDFVTIKRWHELDGAVRGRLDQPVHLKLRFASVGTPDSAADGAVERSVIFMRDVSAIENQAQQLKLASMGRLTASIAHEVRNPLSAIGHATSLLAEDLHGPAETRLLRIVNDNVVRVNRMVEDILKLSRKVQPNGTPVALDAFLAELRTEFTETQQLAEDMVWIGAAGTGDSGGRSVRFDSLHLREVLVNLLGNAIRYASGAAASIRVFPVLDATGRVELHVQDDGPGITPEVRAHLFEPFYTTSSKGTGLGLYLARELCLNNGAMLDYEYRADDSAGGAPGGRFVITFGASA
jgi:two-component system sensor histidine kinase PilS (NtrC family)